MEIQIKTTEFKTVDLPMPFFTCVCFEDETVFARIDENGCQQITEHKNGVTIIKGKLSASMPSVWLKSPIPEKAFTDAYIRAKLFLTNF